MSRLLRGGLVLVVGVAAATSALGSPRQAPDSVAEARALYGQADYEASLALLDRLAQVPGQSGQTLVDTHAVRVLCLIGLGRDDAAREGMARLVDLDPRFSFDRLDVAPRVKAMFLAVRSAELPDVARRRFSAARLALARGDTEAAAREFALVRDVLGEAGLASEPGSALADLRLLASGFWELASRATTTATPLAEPVSPATTTAGRGNPPRAVGTAGRRSDVRLPMPLDEEVPEWVGMLVADGATLRATLDVTVDTRGRVTFVNVVGSTHPGLNRTLVAIAGAWRYQPGALDGKPAQLVRRVTIAVAGRKPQ